MPSLTRTQCISELLGFSAPLSTLKAQLQRFPWSFDGTAVPLRAEHLAGVLKRFVSGELAPGDVEAWANAIEMREDVDYSGDTVEGEVLQTLANPELEGHLSPERAEKLLSALTGPRPGRSSVGV